VRLAHALVEHLPGRLPKVLEAVRPEAAGGAVEVLAARHPEEEVRAIAARIERLLAGGHEPGEIAILLRSVRTSARPFVQALRARRIPVALVGKTSLLAHPEMALVARVFVRWAGGTWYPNADYASETVTGESLLAEIAEVAGLAAAGHGLDGDPVRRPGAEPPAGSASACPMMTGPDAVSRKPWPGG